MARHKRFDRDAVLERALVVFWEKGFAASSLADLTTAMGIGRQSLYDTYGDKRSLYLQAIDRYCAGHGRRFLEPLDADSPSPTKAILDSFAALVDEVSGPEGRRGCMVVNAALECSPDDAELVARIREAAEPTVRLLEGALRRAQVLGEIDPGRDPAELARFLADVIQGMRVSSRTGSDRTSAGASAEIALSVLV